MRIAGFLILLVIAWSYFIPTGQAILGDIASKIQLPIGYLVIVLLGLFPLGLVTYSEVYRKRENPSTYSLLTAFLSIYILIFVLAAFGIVWYGILLYFGLLATIVLGFSRIMNARALE